MPLNRVWLPSPNYSSRGGSNVRLLVIHTAEGSRTIESLGNFFANPSSQVSSHTGADDKPNTIGEYVRRDQKAWTAANANPVACQIELCGFASWSTTEWNTNHAEMLNNCSRWLSEEAAVFGIPLTRLTPSEAQGNGRGICAHSDLGAWGGSHHDPGAGFPMDAVIAQAGGVIPPPTAQPSPPSAGTPAPPFPGTLLRDFTQGHGTRQWQQQMSNRGWRIGVDDMYGSQSATICTQFQREKNLSVDGIVGPETWNATWTAPVT